MKYFCLSFPIHYFFLFGRRQTHRLFLLALLFLFGAGTNMHGLQAQTKRAFTKAGDQAFKSKNYYAALSYYGHALEFDQDNPTLQYQVAETARLQLALELAQTRYQQVLDSPEAQRFPLASFWLATVKQQLGEYEAAKKLFQDYLKTTDSGKPDFAAKAHRAIESCTWALAQTQQPHAVQIEQLNKRINTPYSEFGPYLTGDTLYYSSFQFDNAADRQVPPRKLSKILQSKNGRKGRPLRKSINEPEKLTAHTTFSLDGQRLYYTICEYTDATAIRCQLYYREKATRGRWSPAVALPDTINLAGFTATQPCIGQHPKTGAESLYFVSDRPGGKGQLDIWYAPIKEGTVGNPINLAAINTLENDITPFFHLPSQTLFFSSEGYLGMGGYDIYQTRWDADQWQAAQHTGFPLNSSYNDLYFMLLPDSTQAYFSSNRLGSFYLEEDNKVCCNDLYLVQIPTPPPPVEVVEIPEPSPADSSLSVPPQAPVLPVIPPQIVATEPVDTPKIAMSTPDPLPLPKPTPPVAQPLEALLPIALYFHNDEPGRHSWLPSTKKEYKATYQDYYDLKATYLDAYLKPLPVEEHQAARQEIEALFEDYVKKGYDNLDLFSTLLLQRLKAGTKIELFIQGYTSPRATNDYNLFLGKRRISSLRNHFNKFQDQAFLPYLQSGSLLITEKSFGETTASPLISDDLLDLRNSVYHPEAARERRVEIVEIKQR